MGVGSDSPVAVLAVVAIEQAVEGIGLAAVVAVRGLGAEVAGSVAVAVVAVAAPTINVNNHPRTIRFGAYCSIWALLS